MDQLSLAAAVATRGRADVVCGLLGRLRAQTRPADAIVVSVASQEDARGVNGVCPSARIVLGEPGVAAQRNRALDALGARADIVVFLDDDFTPSPNMFARIEALFACRPSLAGATGHVVKDGAGGAPIDAAEADRLAAALDAAPPPHFERAAIGLYGCNMAIRASHAGALRFDERLPLYGWQEDLDFGARLAKRGEVIRTTAFGGVHRGVKTGRHPQRGLGYAQIANPVHLMREGAIPKGYLLKLMARNVAANAVGAVSGDPWADRRGRLKGNIIAFRDLARGRLDPTRAVDL